MRRSTLNWERLVRSALVANEWRSSNRDPRTTGGTAENVEGYVVPPSLGTGSNIDVILQASDSIQHDDPQVARILCEYAYSRAHDLDPQSEGRGVLQFKTGLISVIRQKKSKRDGGKIDRSHDITRIQDFYEYYRKKHKIDQLEELEKKRRQQGNYEEDAAEMEQRVLRMRTVYQTSKVLNEVLNALTEDASPEEADKLISKELKKVMETDAAKTSNFKPFNILPIETPGAADEIMLFSEVTAAIASLEYTRDLPTLPEGYPHPEQRRLDVFDVLLYIFGFQRDNMNNQREHLLLLLANAQARLGVLPEGSKLDESSVNLLFERLLDNYMKWCAYLRVDSMCARAVTGPRKLLLMSLYLLIWGEAANLRFLPECLCYIFHQMADEMYGILGNETLHRSKTYVEGNEFSFLEKVITPVYEVVLAESQNNNNGKGGHGAWRNYDDFNEYFWSKDCFELSWPWRVDAGFFMKPKIRVPASVAVKPAPLPEPGRSKEKKRGKTNFVEHRTAFHIYHSFHRLWMFFTLALQGMAVYAFCGKLNTRTFKLLLSVGPTFAIMKFVQAILDVILMTGAYSGAKVWNTGRIFVRLVFFAGLAGAVTYLYYWMISEDGKGTAGTTSYHIYLIVLGSFAAAQAFVMVNRRVPIFRRQADKCSNWWIVRFILWVHHERYYVGRGLYERTRDYIVYTLFWVLILGCKFVFSYHFQVSALVSPTKLIINLSNIPYKWHDILSNRNHNAITILTLWAPVLVMYYLDTQVWYTIVSALVGGIDGARQGLGEIRSLSMLRKRFSTFPEAFATNMQPTKSLNSLSGQVSMNQHTGWSKSKVDAVKFAPMWNDIIKFLREEDLINNKEKELLVMPSNLSSMKLVQWPLFLLANKVYMAVEMAQDNRSSTQTELWSRIGKDEYMRFAVEEAYDAVQSVLNNLVNDEAKSWVRSVFGDIESGLQENMLVGHFHLKKVNLVLARITALTGILVHEETPDRIKQAVLAMQDVYETVMHDLLSVELREKFEGWPVLFAAKNEGRLFSNLNWPSAKEEADGVKRLHYLLTIKESASNCPRNLEARRRLEFFTNSLFMRMPSAPPVRKMFSFSVFTPYYDEDVLYSKDQLRTKNEDGITIVFYLQKIYPDEWRNYLERIGVTDSEMGRQLEKDNLDLLELRLWASYRGQTLARTVRGMMYYKKALMLQSILEGVGSADIEEGAPHVGHPGSSGARSIRAQAELKFTYVVTCQIYGQQRQKRDARAADISYLMQKNESLRVAYVDIVEKLKDEKVTKLYFSKLIKADVDGKDQEIYSIKLPGEFKLGEGKPENQNHAIIFTRGDAIQTIDMNQDNYFEETYKMRNLLEEFDSKGSLRKPAILGVREHVFTGSVSSLAWFMSQQEASFVTLGQRVLARPLKVRMHYGHPDVFDRVFHLTRGGISKASRTINISEDIFAGFNCTLRQGNVTHQEYIQVGKGRDVGLNQIATFEGKVSSGNGEQVLSRDVYRLGQFFDFFRMLSFFYTSVGYYVTTLMTALTVYIFLYGKAYQAFSGVGAYISDVASITDNKALQSAIDTQFLLQIGIFTAIPMIVNFVLEQGVLKACTSFLTMQLQLCSVFFTFSLGTRTHYFGRTILHGGAKYRATGRGFVVRHIQFAENYRLYSRSHFVKGLEIALLLIVYAAYGANNTGWSYVLLSFSSWFMALSWLFAPYIFNPSGFEWQKTVEDFDDWTSWLLYRGGVSVKGAESWESWLEEELEHIRSWRGRFWEIILSLRFFFFQYGVVYSLSVAQSSTSLKVYGYSWLVLIGMIILFKIFTFSQKASINFQLLFRLFQGVLFVSMITGVILCIVYTSLSVGDCFAILLAFIPTGWGLLCIASACRPILEALKLWDSIRSVYRLYDAMMGAIIFIPIAILSWFPFVSTFQTRLVFNQAFSRGLEISLILAGDRPNAST